MMSLKRLEGLGPQPLYDPALCCHRVFPYRAFPNNPHQISHTVQFCVAALLLLHLLSKDWVFHSGTQHSKEEGGKERAKVEGHPGDGVGHHNFLPLPVHRLDNLIGQDGWPHAMGHLPGDNCGRTDAFSLVYTQHKTDILNTLRVMRNCIFCTPESK